MSVADKAQVCPDGTTDYKPLRSRARDINRTHIQDVPLTWGNWHKKVDWLNTTFVIFIPAIGLISSYWVPLHPYTAIFSAIYYFNTGLGITAGTLHVCLRPTINLTNSRLSSSVVPPLVQGHSASADLPRCDGCRCRGRIHPVVGKGPSCTSSVYRHRPGSLLCQQRFPVFTSWLDGDETESQATWSYGYLGSQ